MHLDSKFAPFFDGVTLVDAFAAVDQILRGGDISPESLAEQWGLVLQLTGGVQFRSLTTQSIHPPDHRLPICDESLELIAGD